jgi:hypothetical protein
MSRSDVHCRISITSLHLPQPDDPMTLENQLERIVDNIIELPRNFQSIGNTSIRHLVQESGYIETRSLIQDDIIRKRLALTPSLVQDWIEYSADKRTSTGWYFRRTPNGSYETGYLGNKGLTSVYTNRIEACVQFIRRELAEIIRMHFA